MKNMFKYAAAAVILSASLVSCELDNYDGPNAQIYGEVRDSKTGALIQQDINGTKIMYEELGFENPDRQQMIFKVSGEYRNNLMFAAKYDIYFEESNFVIPDRLEGYEIKRGETGSISRCSPTSAFRTLRSARRVPRSWRLLP